MQVIYHCENRFVCFFDDWMYREYGNHLCQMISDFFFLFFQMDRRGKSHCDESWIPSQKRRVKTRVCQFFLKYQFTGFSLSFLVFLCHDCTLVFHHRAAEAVVSVTFTVALRSGHSAVSKAQFEEIERAESNPASHLHRNARNTLKHKLLTKVIEMNK